MYSAELYPQNKSKIVKKQWEGLKSALEAEREGLRLYDVIIEVLNPYDNIVLIPRLEIEDTSPKKFSASFMGIDTIGLRNKNSRFVAWAIALLLCYAWVFCMVVLKMREKKTGLAEIVVQVADPIGHSTRQTSKASF